MNSTFVGYEELNAQSFIGTSVICSSIYVEPVLTSHLSNARAMPRGAC